jgi:anti-sigma B factor antagonist
MQSRPTIEIDRSVASVTIVTLRGEHDLSSAPELRYVLEKAAADGDHVTLGLSVVSFIDSTILAVIIGGLRRARELNLGFTLFVAHEDNLTRILEITGLLAVFPAYRTQEEAVDASLAGRNRPD